ncbi:MAG: type II toxin-antitoxin system VapC family toxin [Thioploca sp.]|nr:type II toxin-antitoxin system VapC family toxin [Thioploca sp.]
MITVDTNILVRYAIKDEPVQTAVATDFLAQHQCLVLPNVLLELIWVLGSSSGYALPREVIVKRVRHILGLSNIVVDDVTKVALALEWYEAGMDFADALHIVGSFDTEGFATFDKRIIKNVEKLAIPQKIVLLTK